MTAVRHRGSAVISQRGRGLFFIIAGMVIGASVAGCAGRDFAAIRPGIEARGAYIEAVPFYRQTESLCGPAALAGVLSFWGRPLSPERIAERIYLPELRGTLPTDMENFAREQGFETASSNGTLDHLKEHIRRGVPVICLLDLGFGPYRRPHYVTAVGFDDVRAVIVEHDGLRPDQLMEYKAFDKAWLRAGRWMLVIKPKEAETRHES